MGLLFGVCNSITSSFLGWTFIMSFGLYYCDGSVSYFALLSAWLATALLSIFSCILLIYALLLSICLLLSNIWLRSITLLRSIWLESPNLLLALILSISSFPPSLLFPILLLAILVLAMIDFDLLWLILAETSLCRSTTSFILSLKSLKPIFPFEYDR